MKETALTSFSKWKPIELMLAVLFLIAPLYYHPNVGGAGLRIPNNITAWILVTIIIVYSFHSVLKRPTIVLPKYFIFLAAFPILITVSGLITGVEQPIEWVFRLLFLWGGLAFFFSFFQHGLKQGRIDRILFVIAVSALLQGLVAIGQLYLEADILPWWPGSLRGIPAGTFQQINNQATYQVTAIFISVYLLLRPFGIHSKVLRTTLLIVIALASFIVLMSGSRVGLLSMILGLLIFTFTQSKKIKSNKKISLFGTGALILGIGLGIIQGDNSSIDKTVSMQSGYSGSARLAIYSISLDLIKEQPLLGYGVGSFGREFQHAKAAFLQQYPDALLPHQYISHPHNEIVLWFVENGLIAIIGLFLLLIGTLLALGRKGLYRGGAYMAMILPIALHTQVELPFYITALHFFVCIVILAAIYNGNSEVKVNKLSPAAIKLSFYTIPVVCLASIFFLIHSMVANFELQKFYKERKLDFSAAESNAYFYRDVDWLVNRTTLHALLDQQVINEDIAHSVINWYTKAIAMRPDIVLYEDLFKLYFAMGLHDEGCKWFKRSMYIYPETKVGYENYDLLCH